VPNILRGARATEGDNAIPTERPPR
jgi:hypothetical protein